MTRRFRTPENAVRFRARALQGREAATREAHNLKTPVQVRALLRPAGVGGDARGLYPREVGSNPAPGSHSRVGERQAARLLSEKTSVRFGPLELRARDEVDRHPTF